MPGVVLWGHMRRRAFITLLSSTACAWPLAVRAQQPAMPVIGVLGSASATADKERLKLIGQGLAESGFTEGNVAMDYRWAEGQLERLPALAAELVDRRPNVIIATGGLQTPRAAILATSTIPIVFCTDGDPVKQGLVASLNRPGGNATGITVFSASLTAKRLELFRGVVPSAQVFATPETVVPLVPLGSWFEMKEANKGDQTKETPTEVGASPLVPVTWL